MKFPVLGCKLYTIPDKLSYVLPCQGVDGLSSKDSTVRVEDAPLRQAHYWTPEVEMHKRADGSILIHQVKPLGDYPDRLADRLVYWAEKTPDQLYLADRGADGEWRKITYAEMLASARRLGEGLLKFNLSAEHPLLILSGNDLEHARLALACYYSGVPFSPLSPAYSLVSKDFAKLKDVLSQLEPGLVFAADGEQFGAALKSAVPKGTPLLVTKNPPNADTFLFEDIANTEATALVDEAFDKIKPESIVKFMFTSGSTGSPKAVISTNKMLCSNQAMVVDCYAFMADNPPIVLDWSPWNHTAGGNKVFNMVLYNGGTLYVDDGNPTPKGMVKTIRNLHDVAPTWYFNVPRGYEELVLAFEADEVMRDNFFSEIKMLMYSGAGLAQHTFDALQRLAVASTGERVLVAAGLGASETGPFAIMCTWDAGVASNVGLPARGLEMKLVPVDDKLEVRLKGPSITPGYWKDPELTAKAFDEEGYYNLGDAIKFVDPDDVMSGFLFDGRTAENFKLNTGTWVGVGALRGKLIDHFGGLVMDAVLTGLNEDYLGALLLPNWGACRALVDEKDLTDVEVAAHEKVRATFKEKLISFGKQSTGSSTRVRRVLILDMPLSIDLGEITGKASINQRAVLRHRAGKVAEIYSGSSNVIDDT